MSKGLQPILATSLLILAILACNVPGSQANSQPNLAGTITAQAMTLQAPTGASASAADTPSPSVPEASVTQTTNCRTGPGTNYSLVFTMNPGDNEKVIGKDTPDNYWVINNPAGGSCWLWGQYTVVSGDTSALPEYPAPSAPTAKATKTPKPTSTSTVGAPPITIKPIPVTLVFTGAPSAPTGLSGTRDSCTTGIASDGFTPIWIETLSLHWTDNANDETGYYVYKNGGQISTIPANSTSFHLTYRYEQNSQNPLYITFGVAAFNSFGKSATPTWDIPTCP